MTIRVMVHREVHELSWHQCSNCKSEMTIGINDFRRLESAFEFEDNDDYIIGINCPVCNTIIEKNDQYY